MYTLEQIVQMQLKTSHYFHVSLNINFKHKTKKETDLINYCMQTMHQARLQYDLKYRKYYDFNKPPK